MGKAIDGGVKEAKSNKVQAVVLSLASVPSSSRVSLLAIRAYYQLCHLCPVRVDMSEFSLVPNVRLVV